MFGEMLTEKTWENLHKSLFDSGYLTCWSSQTKILVLFESGKSHLTWSSLFVVLSFRLMLAVLSFIEISYRLCCGSYRGSVWFDPVSGADLRDGNCTVHHFSLSRRDKDGRAVLLDHDVCKYTACTIILSTFNPFLPLLLLSRSVMNVNIYGETQEKNYTRAFN